MSQLIPLLAKLKESNAERVIFIAGQEPIAIEGEAKRALGGGPIPAAAILSAVSELLSQEDIAGLTNRPRVVRHEQDGEEFVLEIARHGNGVALGARPAVRAARPAANAAPPPRREEKPPARQSVRPKKGASIPPGRRKSKEIDVALAKDGAWLSGGVAEGAPQLAPEAVREIARQVAVETAREVARQVAIDAAREINQGAPQSTRGATDVAGQTREAVIAAAREAAAEEARAIVREHVRDARPADGARAAPAPRAEVAPIRTGPAKIDALLREMLQRKASDLHLTSNAHPVFRVDGEVHFGSERPVQSSAEILSMVQEIMTPKARGDFETLHDADFAHEIPGLARFRVNVFQDRVGTGAVLRQIPIEVLSAEKLGLPKACLDMCWLSKGLVLVTGPTGSGKSTTLAAMIDFINKNRSDHIITIEDPVEFIHQNQKCLVNQREVGQHTKSFKNALRAALREDPDIVLVGEMRDLETISIAIETAETGHLVFGTLHTTTAISTIDRIIDQFPSDRQEQIRVMLSESLKGVVAQVLCPKIGGGRVAAQEILVGNHAVAAMIREGKTFQIASTMQTSKNQGMVTMNDALMNLVQKKLVDPKQAYLKAVDKNGFTTMLRSAGIAPPV